MTTIDHTIAESAKFDLAGAPFSVGTVTLRVRELNQVTGFYQRALGLDLLYSGNESARLGADGRTLLELRAEPGILPRDPTAAGLFHTAFLLPSRGDLARWLVHAREAGLRLDGASDHVVSEAIYLSDPEGNGIEIYADRPPGDWNTDGTGIAMRTDPLDIADLLSATDGRTWTGAPAGTVIGHVHLQVGDTASADQFYRDILGFEVMARYPGASFFGSGGYHHQFAGNVWNSPGAGHRDESRAGLAGLALEARDRELVAAVKARATGAGVAVEGDDTRLLLRDPWGTPIVIRPR